VASLSQGRTAAAQCGLFTHKSVPVIFEPPCMFFVGSLKHFWHQSRKSCQYLQGLKNLLRIGSCKFITSKNISYKFRSFKEVSAVVLLQVLTFYKIIFIVQFESIAS